MGDAATWGSVGSVMLGTATGGAYGAWQEGQAKAAAANYNATIQRQNALIAKEGAAIAGQAGSEQAWMMGQKTKAMVGGIKANQGAAGIEVNSGSAVDTRVSAAELGELDALTIRSNAAREAYGYTQQARSHEQQAVLSRYEADQDKTAGTLNAVNTFLGSAGSAAGNFAKYQLAGGFGG